LHPRLIELLAHCRVKSQSHSPLLFTAPRGGPLRAAAVRSSLRRAVAQAGIEIRMTPHHLRHAFATHSFAAGADIRLIQVVLGHRSIRTTARYVQVSNDAIAAMPTPLRIQPRATEIAFRT